MNRGLLPYSFIVFFSLQWWFIGSSSSGRDNISSKSLCIYYWFDHCAILDISDEFSSSQLLQHFSLLLYVLSNFIFGVPLSDQYMSSFQIILSFFDLLRTLIHPSHHILILSTLFPVFFPFPGQKSLSIAISITWATVSYKPIWYIQYYILVDHYQPFFQF